MAQPPFTVLSSLSSSKNIVNTLANKNIVLVRRKFLRLINTKKNFILAFENLGSRTVSVLGFYFRANSTTRSAK